MRRARIALATALSLAGLAFACGSAAGEGLPGQGFLPDGRAYELVSAADKNGADVSSDSTRVRVADDGNAVTYSSLNAFGDAIGTGIAPEYMAVRGGGGWSTHAISPRQPGLTLQGVLKSLEPHYETDLSPDLSKGVLFAWRPLTEAPAVENVTNLYLRDDLRSPGEGHYQLLTDCPVCISPFSPEQLTVVPKFIAGTPDFGQLLFETPLNLVAGASGGSPKLYEWDHGTLRLAGRIPAGGTECDDEVGPACIAAASSGAGAGTVYNGLTYTHHVISSDGSKVFFSAGGNLYMRENGSNTVQIASNAQYNDASASGSRVFFTSGLNLYMYETTDGNLSPLASDVDGVIGASADGSTVYYFTFNNRILVWHEGTTSFIRQWVPGDIPDDMTDQASAALIPKTARVSPSGDLVFPSTEPIGPGGFSHGICSQHLSGACRELYVYNLAKAELSCASCFSGNGEPPHTDAYINVDGTGGSSRTRHLNRVISDNGRYVFFTTREPLVPEDTNHVDDAYEYDVATGTIHLLSSGTAKSNSYFLETSASGDDAFLLTRQQLVGWDKDLSYDLYDARVGGGFAEPAPTPAPCAGESCRGSQGTAPAQAAVTSSILVGPGNHRVKRHGKKSRKHRKHRKASHQHQRAADGNRRAAR